jgi:hypothetical protein
VLCRARSYRATIPADRGKPPTSETSEGRDRVGEESGAADVGVKPNSDVAGAHPAFEESVGLRVRSARGSYRRGVVDRQGHLPPQRAASGFAPDPEAGRVVRRHRGIQGALSRVRLNSEPLVVNEVGRNRRSSGVFRASGDRIELSRGMGEEKPVDCPP